MQSSHIYLMWPETAFHALTPRQCQCSLCGFKAVPPLRRSLRISLAAWTQLNEEIFVLQEFIFQSLELFELTKPQKAVCFSLSAILQRVLPSSWLRPVSSQHIFGTRQWVRIFIWSKMLNSGHILLPLYMNAVINT